jgi:hypothetical protein
MFSLSLFVSFVHLEFPGKFLYSCVYRAVSQLSTDVLSEEVGMSFVAIGILKPQAVRD